VSDILGIVSNRHLLLITKTPDYLIGYIKFKKPTIVNKAQYKPLQNARLQKITKTFENTGQGLID